MQEHVHRSKLLAFYCYQPGTSAFVWALDEVRRGVPSHVTGDIAVQPLLSVDELRERMSGNICRCGAYSNIVDAITEVAGKAA